MKMELTYNDAHQDAVMDLLTGRAYLYTVPAARKELHDIFGGRYYYTSVSGVTGCGYVDKMIPRLCKVSSLGGRRYNRVSQPFRTDVASVEAIAYVHEHYAGEPCFDQILLKVVPDDFKDSKKMYLYFADNVEQNKLPHEFVKSVGEDWDYKTYTISVISPETFETYDVELLVYDPCGHRFGAHISFLPLVAKELSAAFGDPDWNNRFTAFVPEPESDLHAFFGLYPLNGKYIQRDRYMYITKVWDCDPLNDETLIQDLCDTRGAYAWSRNGVRFIAIPCDNGRYNTEVYAYADADTLSTKLSGIMSLIFIPEKYNKYFSGAIAASDYFHNATLFSEREQHEKDLMSALYYRLGNKLRTVINELALSESAAAQIERIINSERS